MKSILVSFQQNNHLVLFEPKSRLYLWLLTWAPSNASDPDPLGQMASRSALAIGNNRIAWFGMGSASLSVFQSSQTAASLDDACEKSLSVATRQLPILEHYASRQCIEVEIGRQLVETGRLAGADFFEAELRSAPRLFPVHVEVDHVNGNWEMSLTANLKAKVLLNDRFEVLKVEQVK